MERFARTLGIVAIIASTATGVMAGGDDASLLQSYQLTDLEGSNSSLSDHRGEVVVVNFWASWCAPCLSELPTLDAWHTAWEGQGARVAAISVDNEARKARRFVEKANLQLDVFHDGPNGLASKLDIPFLPCTYVLDRNGEIALISGGASEQELERVRRTVEGLIGTSASAMAASDGGAR